MLSKKYRMKKNSQFDYIFRNGKTIKSNKMLVFYSKSKSKNPKIGIVVSKKIGKSVIRNHVKRLIRESVYKNMQNLDKNLNYIFVARQGIENLNFNEIYSTIYGLITKIDNV